MWNLPKAILAGVMSAILFAISEVVFRRKKVTAFIKTFVFDVWYLWVGLIITISYLLVLQVMENRKLEFDVICPQIYNWMDKRTYDSQGNRITGECPISFDDFIRDFPLFLL